VQLVNTTIIQTRILTPHQSIWLLNEYKNAFQYQWPNSPINDFPWFFNDSYFRQCHLNILESNTATQLCEHYFLYLQGRKDPIGHVAAVYRQMNQDKNIYTALIGGVFIISDFQEKGFFSQFFIQSLRYIEKKSHWQFLWSSEKNLYKKFNFNTLPGYQEIKIRSSKNRMKEKFLYQLSTKTQYKILQSLPLTNNIITFRRNLHEIENLIKTSTVKVIHIEYQEPTDSEIQSFYCLHSKGQDLPQIIFEIYPLTKRNLTFLIENGIDKKLGDFKLWIPSKIFEIMNIKIDDSLIVGHLETALCRLSLDKLKQAELKKDLAIVIDQDDFGVGLDAYIKDNQSAFFISGLDSV